MSKETNNLKLFKYDPVNDGNSTFSIDKALNENWDKIDEDIHTIKSDFDNYKKDYTSNNGFGKTSGTSTSYVLTLDPAPTAYVDGMQITIVPHVDNATNPTLNINNLGASSILKSDGTAPKEGQIKTNKPLALVRVGNNFFISSGGKYDVGDILPESSVEVAQPKYETREVWKSTIGGSGVRIPSVAYYNDILYYTYYILKEDDGTINTDTFTLTARSSTDSKYLWSANIPQYKYLSDKLVATSDGVYVGGSNSAYPMIEYYTTSGSKIWSIIPTTRAGIVLDMCVINGSLYVTTSEELIKMDSVSGKVSWRFLNKWSWSVNADNDYIYLGGDGHLYKLGLDGSKLSETTICTGSLRNICIHDKSVYVSSNSSMYKLDQDLKLILTCTISTIMTSMYNYKFDRLILADSGSSLYIMSTTLGTYVSVQLPKTKGIISGSPYEDTIYHAYTTNQCYLAKTSLSPIEGSGGYKIIN